MKENKKSFKEDPGYCNCGLAKDDANWYLMARKDDCRKGVINNRMTNYISKSLKRRESCNTC